jgi:hypothetical protein
MSLPLVTPPEWQAAGSCGSQSTGTLPHRSGTRIGADSTGRPGRHLRREGLGGPDPCRAVLRQLLLRLLPASGLDAALMHLRPLLPAAVPSVDPNAGASGRRTADGAADVADLGEWQADQAALFEAFGTRRTNCGVSVIMRPVRSAP